MAEAPPPRPPPKLMKPNDLRRILTNVLGDPPQIYLAIYDPVMGEVIGGPWSSVEIHDNRLVILVKARTTSELVLDAIRRALRFLRQLRGIVGLPVKGEPGFP